VVTNVAGTVTSTVATLTIRSPDRPTILVGGKIEGTVIWSQTNAVYSVTSDLEVPYGTSLEIQPGISLEGNGKALWVGGNLDAVGHQESTGRRLSLDIAVANSLLQALLRRFPSWSAAPNPSSISGDLMAGKSWVRQTPLWRWEICCLGT
jgi:hypothetical protein